MAKHGTVRVVKPYELHGVLYYQLAVAVDGERDALRDIRICHDSIYDRPVAGDDIEFDIVLSVVTEVRKRT